MKLKRTLKRVYLPAMLGIILCSVAFRIAAIFVNLNLDTGFFDGKTLINIASLIVSSGAIFLFTYAFCGSKKYKLIADFSTPATYVPTGVLTVAMMFFAALTWIQSSASEFSIRGYFSSPDPKFSNVFKYITSDMSGFLLSIMAPLALLSIGYFILNACILERASGARAFFGITNVLFLALYSSYLYFDTATLARNAPNKIVDQMAFLFAALFFLYEIRISLGREKWNLYVAFGLIASTLTAYSSIPSLVLYFVNGSVISNNIQENILSLALFVFITSRIVLASFLREDKESESIQAIKEYSNERRDFIKSKEEASKKAYIELYEELNELEDTEFAEGAEPKQMTFDESLEILEKPGSEYAETELYIPQISENVISDDENDIEQSPDLIQESILFPQDTEEYDEESQEAKDSDDI